MQWKTIKRYPKYEIREDGLIRNKKSKKVSYIRSNKQGYKYIQFRENHKIKTEKIHRLVAEHFLPKPTDTLIDKCSNEHWGEVIVKHKDNDKHNNHYSNLVYSDLADNTRQAWEDGLIPALKGSSNGMAELTEGLVHKVCKSFEEGMMPKEAVEVYGISRSQATKIRSGHAWKHVSELYNIKVNKRTTKTFND